MEDLETGTGLDVAVLEEEKALQGEMEAVDEETARTGRPRGTRRVIKLDVEAMTEETRFRDGLKSSMIGKTHTRGLAGRTSAMARRRTIVGQAEIAGRIPRAREVAERDPRIRRTEATIGTEEAIPGKTAQAGETNLTPTPGMTRRTRGTTQERVLPGTMMTTTPVSPTGEERAPRVAEEAVRTKEDVTTIQAMVMTITHTKSHGNAQNLKSSTRSLRFLLTLNLTAHGLSSSTISWIRW